jgi:hypothetical protein
MSIIEKVKEETTIKISGVMLIFLANVLKERQVAIFMSLAEAIENDEHNVEDLENAAMANEVVGAKILSCIEAHLGKEDYEKFLNGKLKIDGLNSMSSPGAIN